MQTEMIQGFELSPQQRRIWVLQESGVPPLHAQLVLRIEGPLDRDRLRQAIDRVVARHEILHTGFAAFPGMGLPLQVLNEPALSWGEGRATAGLSQQDRTAALESLLEELRETTIDWQLGPVVRALLLADGEERHLVVVDLPALCADSVTLARLPAEIAADYAEGGRDGGEAPLQYSDLSAWQNELLTSEDAEPGRLYWQRQEWWRSLANPAPFVSPATSSDRFAPRWLAVDLAPSLQRDALALVGQRRGSVHGLLLACWQALLWRLTDGEEVLVGVSFDGRKYEETENVLGPLAKYLPVAVQPDAATPLAGLWRQCEEILAQHATWQECFVWDGTPAGGVLRHDRFSLGFEAVEECAPWQGGDLAFMLECRRACAEPFALLLRCRQTVDGLALELVYDAVRCETAGARQLAAALAALLAAGVAKPEAAIGSLGLLDGTALQQALVAGKDTSAEREPCCLHELFRQQALRTPEAVAAVSAEETLTYAELARRSSEMARLLRRVGIGPEERVGLFVERSISMIVGILGVLEAGGAYVPLDPGYPRERTAYVLGHAAPRVLLTRSDLLSRLPVTASTILLLDGNELPAASGSAPVGPVTPDNLAYVLYTSGSSGRPKGVMVSHRAIINRLLWMQNAFPLNGSDRVLQKTPFSFDASIWEIWSPLIAGACMVLARPDGHKDAAYLLGLIAEEKVTVLQLVPSMLPVFLDQPGVSAAGGRLRRLFCGGEALPADLVDRAFALLPGLSSEGSLCNLYGPTEAAIDVAFQVCTAGRWQGVVPIGYPLDNLRLYVLDRWGNPLPPGLPGDLHIGGINLARGYLDRPDLTAERFVPDAWSSLPGERLYRTGDLVRWTGEVFEFLGRADHQVKIRGFRIELEEIEAALLRQPGVREAAVVVREDVPAERRLVAYVALADSSAEDVPFLRATLAESLPEYMVPSAIVILPALPRLPNGKLDRRALPSPESTRRTVGRPARNLTEEVLAGIWTEILSLPRVGMEESFFALGGHSLSATQLASRVRLVFGIDLALRTIFDHPTVAALADRIDAQRRVGHGLIAPPIQPMPRDVDPPLSFSQQRLWFIQKFEPGNTTYNISCGARLLGPLDRAALAAALSEVCRRHEALRTSFPEVEGQPVQRIDPPGEIGLPLVDLSSLPRAWREGEARRLALAQAMIPFQLDRVPLLRALVVCLEPREHAILLVMHHIVSDGWSTEILVRELSQLYTAFRSGLLSPLPKLSVQYGDFAHWQRQWLHGEVLNTQVAYWKAQLEGLRVLELPTDRPRPPVQTFRGALTRARVGPATTERLRGLARREGATLFMAVLAGFMALLQRYSGQDDIAVGCPIANRNRAEIEPLIGCFVNLVVLRSRIADGTGFDQLITRVREVSLASSTYQDVPFEQVVDAVQPVRDLSRNALFQVAFMLQTPRAEPHLSADLRIADIEVGIGTAKFDLTLELSDNETDLTGFLDFNQDLFDRSTAARLVAHFDRLLEAASLHPERPVGELDLLAEEERHQLLAEWNDTADASPRGVRLDELFARQAARQPEAIAVISGEESLTYGELERCANRLADHLRVLGVQPGDLVGIYLSRGAEMILAPLAVLKAGATYVPFDIHFPAARIRWILETFSISTLLTESCFLEAITRELDGLPALQHRLCLDQLSLETEGLSTPPPVGAESEVAYIIFTSGSTGTPKGVVVRHEPAANLIGWVNRTFDVGPRDRVLFVTSLAFDLSVYDMFGLLAAGGSIRVASQEELAEPRRLLESLETEPITFWDSAPALLQQLAPYFAPRPGGDLPALRLVFLSGDWIPVTLPDSVRRSFPRAQVIGLGGATEAAIWSNFFPIGEVPPQWRSIPYGRPTANARYHVLDDRLDPCPVGVPGDLFIAGLCLASGYAAEPFLTAFQFMPDPFTPVSGARMYRTGDRARYFADGNLEFLGRRDHQIKIRGFRIELGEVEAALREDPAVREAVVLAREDVPGNKRLVAYVIQEREIDLAELRRTLRRRLPEYMIPSAFLLLPEFPVTANGKLDREALPAPEQDEAARPESFIPPRTPTEEAIAEIWREVLAVESVGAGDNFFVLGGHSLTATQVLSRIRSVCGVELPLRELFQAETLASLAERVEAAVLAVAAPRELERLMEELAHLSEEEAEQLLASGETLAGGASRREPAENFHPLVGGER